MNATREAEPAAAATNRPRACELSVIMPCNEADTLALGITTAQRVLDEHAVDSEIVVTDNGSTDESPAIARALLACVIDVPTPGYGGALCAGLAAAEGRFALMGDSDASYDFSEIPRSLADLRKGADVVLGCRLPAGGGRVLPGAMPFLHRWVGPPVFSWLAVASASRSCSGSRPSSSGSSAKSSPFKKSCCRRTPVRLQRVDRTRCPAAKMRRVHAGGTVARVRTAITGATSKRTGNNLIAV